MSQYVILLRSEPPPAQLETRPLIGPQSQPMASWDWQWTAKNHANSNCFQHRQMEIIQEDILGLI